MARQDFKAMIGKLPESEVTKIMKQAEGSGVTGLGLRYPMTQHGSIQPVKYKIVSAEVEALASEAGKNLFGGKAYVTVGTQTRWGADFDGDTFSGFLPQLAGKKVRAVDQTVQREMDAWFYKEQKWMKEIADVKYGEMSQKTMTILQRMQGMN